MTPKLRGPLVLSAFAHVLLLLLGAAIARKPRFSELVPAGASPLTVSVSLFNGSSGAPSLGKKSRTPVRSSHLPRLKDLGVFSGASTQAATSPAPYGFEPQLTGRESPLLAYIYQKIDGGIVYPGELRKAGYSGEVTAALRFNAKGEWIESPADIKAGGLGSRYLRIYLIRQLRYLLSEPIPATLWNAEPRALTLHARFVFAIIAPESVIGAQLGPQFAPSADPRSFSETDMDGGQAVERRVNSSRQGIYGRGFLFYRVHLSSPLAWKLGPISGYGIMPTVGIDPMWFPQAISDLFHPRAKFDPLERYRDDPEW